MTIFLRSVRLIALAVWVGCVVFFAFAVARVAFATLPDPRLAGAVVRGTLLELHRIGLMAGGVYFLFTVALIGMQRDTHPARAAELVLIVAMLSLTAYSQFSVVPSMERDRLSLGGDVNAASVNAPARIHFERLHGLSVKLEGAVLLEGLVLLALAPVHGRDDMYRYS